jgi:hypothetical protein
MNNDLKTADKLVQDQFNKAEKLADEINDLIFDEVVDATLILDALSSTGMKLAPDTSNLPSMAMIVGLTP